MRRWVARILGGLLIVLLVGVGAIYALSNRVINARHPFREHPVSRPADSASLARGERLARLRCVGCHGDSLRGRILFDGPMLARLVAPNVPARLASLSDAEFAGFLRSGVRKDGTSPFEMPPPGFYHISDADLGGLIAYLRSQPVTADSLPGNAYRLLGRLAIALGQITTAVTAFDTSVARVGDDPTWATTRHGEYLARLICTECHGVRLTGSPAADSGAAPSLAGAVGYSPEQFVTLLRTGTPRESTTRLGQMAETARKSLRYFTDDEIDAIYQYLKALPSTGVPSTR